MSRAIESDWILGGAKEESFSGLGMFTWVVRSNVLWESPACSHFDAVEALKVTDAIIHRLEKFSPQNVFIMVISNEPKCS